MTRLIAVCRCGTEADASTFRRNLCRSCQAGEACAQERAELARLWKRREGYRARGVSVEGPDRQATRVRQRMERRCAEIEPDPLLAHNLAVRQAELADPRRPRRILVPA